MARTDSGCAPNRNLLSPDGRQLWITARASNALLAFNTNRLISHGNDFLVANVQVGTLPLGLALVKNGTRMLVANSDRYTYRGAHAGITIVDVRAALEGSEDANLREIFADSYPREIAVSPDGKMALVSENGASRIRAVDIDTVP